MTTRTAPSPAEVQRRIARTAAKVQRAQDAAEAAKVERDQAIRDAAAAGLSARSIASIAGLSHPGVLKILQR
jgi:hypothetical protein